MPDEGFIILGVCFGFVVGLTVGLQRHRWRGRGYRAGASMPGDAVTPDGGRAERAMLAQVSHEMRTPLTAILGFADALQAGGLSEDDKQVGLRAITRNGRHLLRLISDVLDFSRIEAGKLEVHRAICSPSEVVRDAMEMVHGLAAMKGLSLTVDVSSEVPQRVLLDPIRARQILANLLSNSVKYTAEGEIRLQIAWVPAQGEEEEDLLQFDVVDSGVGLSAAEANNLFEAYFRGGSDLSRQQGGTGLGLSISRKLARLMGGDVTLVSTRPDGGSHFRATIPIGHPRRDAVFAPTGPEGGLDPGPPGLMFAPLVGRRVLVAEDCTDSQRLLRFVLTKAGASVGVASNGREAVEMVFKEEPEAAPFDAIVMDMQMPILDGYSATRELRERGFDRGIIALTALAAQGDRERCIDAGCDEYLSKPFDRAALVGAVARTCDRTPCGAAS